MDRITKLFVVLAVALLSGCVTTGGNRPVAVGEHHVPNPPMVLHNGRYVPQGSPGTMGSFGNYHGSQFAIPPTVASGQVFQTSLGGRQVKMVMTCSWKDRLATAGLDAVIGAGVGLAVDMFRNRNREDKDYTFTKIGALGGASYGASDFGCKPELVDDGDAPGEVAVIERQGGRMVSPAKCRIDGKDYTVDSRKDCDILAERIGKKETHCPKGKTTYVLNWEGKPQHGKQVCVSEAERKEHGEHRFTRASR